VLWFLHRESGRPRINEGGPASYGPTPVAGGQDGGTTPAEARNRVSNECRKLPHGVVTHLRFEAEITPGMAPGPVADLAVEVERAGFDRLGISDVILWHDCYVSPN